MSLNITRPNGHEARNEIQVENKMCFLSWDSYYQEKTEEGGIILCQQTETSQFWLFYLAYSEMEATIHAKSTSEDYLDFHHVIQTRISSNWFTIYVQWPQMKCSIFNGFIQWKIRSVVPLMSLKSLSNYLCEKFLYLTGFMNLKEGLPYSCNPV